ncbi:MAG: hypothetical protein JNM18_16475 [Planctomycetaceae bacterium]|nr:hypothetical protein [Planctomycetaceae bacterium]
MDTPKVVEAATGQYRKDQDILGAFISDSCVIAPNDRAKSADLYAVYAAWCDRNGERPVTRNTFGTAMTERGFERYTNNGTWYRGIGIVSTTVKE